MINTGIITAAGEGRRMFPYTATGRKELAPIGTEPGILRLVKELVIAGITNIHFVVSRGDDRIQRFFQPADAFLATLDPVRRKEHETIRGLAKFFFHEQKPEYPGNGGAIASVELEDENIPLACFWGDTLCKPGSFKDFIASYNGRKSPELSLLYATEIREERMEDAIQRYGFIEGAKLDASLVEINKIIEKPGQNNIARAEYSNFAVLTGYILRPGALKILRATPKDPKTGEIFLTRALDTIQGKLGFIGPLPYDIGSPLGLALANHAYLTEKDQKAFTAISVQGD